MRASTLAAMVMTAGCVSHAPDEAWHHQADIVVETWETYYGEPLTDEQLGCMRDFEVRTVNGWRRLCGSRDTAGCTHVGSRHTNIGVRDDLGPLFLVYTQRHELTHLLLECVAGNLDSDHHHAVFAGDGVVTNPNALPIQADAIEPAWASP